MIVLIVTSQNIQNNTKLQNQSNYNELHRLDVKTIKQLKTTKAINLQWLASIICQNDQNKAKLQKWSKSNDLHQFYVKTIKTKLNYKSDQNPMTCIDLTSKRSKQRKTTKVIKIQWLASIWRQNDQNKAKLQKWSKSNDLHLFDVKTIKNVQLRRKTFKTTQNYKTNQITMNCIDWMSKRSNNLKLQKQLIYNDLHRLYVKMIKTKLNYKSDQNPMTCINFTSKRSKQS